jgi:Asp-tRNA(Asn)/Glu-tRNA(Gln) amidotransferase A subunit family amidase
VHEDLCFLTIARASELIRTRKLSPVALTDAFPARIEAFDPQVNAYLSARSATLRANGTGSRRAIP